MGGTILGIELELKCRITGLVDEITQRATEYYTGQSTISDSEFDKLVEDLRHLDPTHPILFTPGWGYTPDYGRKVPHRYQLVGSLSKYKDMDQLRKDFEGKYLVVTPKLDGLSCVAYYKNGRLVDASTRGNGKEGIDITDKYLLVTNLNNVLSNFTGEVRGELVMRNSDWDIFKSKYPDYKNSRNAVAGIINGKYSTLQEKSELCRYVSFVAYKILGDDSGNRYVSYENILENLNFIGFDVVPICLIDDYERSFEIWKEIYPCDGIVVNGGINISGSKIEYDDVAYKFEDEVVETRVDHIEWNLSRLGKMKPVVIFDPVELDGATIRRATAFNARYVHDNRLGPDAYIKIARSNMVIPDINEVTVESVNYELPKVCPECGSKLEWSGVDLVCKNKNCKGTECYTLRGFINTVAGVKGVSSAGISEIIDILGLQSILDIYNWDLTSALNEISKQDIGNKTKSKYSEIVTKLYSPMDPRLFFCALNLPGLGWKNSCELVKLKFHETLKSSDKFSVFISEKIEEVRGYALRNTLYENINTLIKLANCIEFQEVKDEEPIDKEFKVRYYCVTGAMNYGTRSDFNEYTKQFGWEQSDIKSAEYLVTNNPDPTSSKGRKAKELGKEIITEEEFLNIIKM